MLLGGRFEILQVLGEGGMGTVYKAVDREVDHVVALKLIRPDLCGAPGHSGALQAGIADGTAGDAPKT